jgi:hypothetical protein
MESWVAVAQVRDVVCHANSRKGPPVCVPVWSSGMQSAWGYTTKNENPPRHTCYVRYIEIQGTDSCSSQCCLLRRPAVSAVVPLAVVNAHKVPTGHTRGEAALCKRLQTPMHTHRAPGCCCWRYSNRHLFVCCPVTAPCVPSM